MTRKYDLKRRAEKQAETRRRIVQATVSLHTTDGPARTTISAIAQRAGVERHTVYAHFPDEASLFEACSAHWRELHPFPDGTSWRATTDPTRRLAAALHDVYAWYERVGDDIDVFNRDAAVHELTAVLSARREHAVAGIREAVLARPASAKGRPGSSRACARVRNVAFARSAGGAHAHPGGRRHVELRGKRLAFARWRRPTIAG